MRDTLSTKRLILKPLDKSYINEKYLGWLNDDEVLKFLETSAGSSLSDLEDYLFHIEKNQILAWALHTKASNKHIGNIKIDPIDYKNGYCEYGIMMGDKSEWGKGYAKEASLKIIQLLK